MNGEEWNEVERNEIESFLHVFFGLRFFGFVSILWGLERESI